MSKKHSLERPIAWIEKTINTFAPEYRKYGEFAYGSALLSPTKNAREQDIYHAMRDVQPGDFIIHLVDNEEFDGVSFAAEPYKTVSLEGKEFFAVPLRNFRRLSPPLNRSVLFGKPFGKQLKQMIIDGLKHTFFTHDLKLGQGRYLTPVFPSLMEVFDAAYQSVAGMSLSDLAAPKDDSVVNP
jgi:hypothetical protein